jgi:hypothetical protein
VWQKREEGETNWNSYLYRLAEDIWQIKEETSNVSGKRIASSSWLSQFVRYFVASCKEEFSLVVAAGCTDQQIKPQSPLSNLSILNPHSHAAQDGGITD